MVLTKQKTTILFQNILYIQTQWLKEGCWRQLQEVTGGREQCPHSIGGERVSDCRLRDTQGDIGNWPHPSHEHSSQNLTCVTDVLHGIYWRQFTPYSEQNNEKKQILTNALEHHSRNKLVSHTD